MKSEQMFKYPDFMMEFKELEKIAKWQKSVVSHFCLEANQMLWPVHLVILGDYGYSFLKAEFGAYGTEKVKALFKRYAVTTFEVLKGYITSWIAEGHLALEYNHETNTMHIKTLASEDDRVTRKRIRNLLPCNMELEFEIVSSLS